MRGHFRRIAAYSPYVLGVSEQGISSAATFLYTVLMARSLDATGFGILATLMTVVFIATSVVRALASTPIITYGRGAMSDADVATTGVAASVLVSVLGIPLYVTVGVVIDSPVLGIGLVLAVLFISAGDSLRYSG